MTDPIRLVVFDFDGTLCDSAEVKTDAFHALYLDDHGPDFADAVRRYHLDNAGVSRYAKIRHVESEMLGVEPTPQRIEEVASRFSTLVEHAVIAAPLFPGVLTFLERAHTVIPLAIASATPTDELARIVEAKDLSKYFTTVEGSPRSKGEILRSLVVEAGVEASDVVMVGDQPSDLAGAREAGTRAIVITDDPGAFAAPTVPRFTDAAAWLSDRLPLGAAGHRNE